MIKTILRIVPYPIFAKIYYNITAWNKDLFLKKIKRKNFYKTLDIIDLTKYKKSEKLFILGSGFSLNNITTNQWKEINSNDSFGFNFSLLNTNHIPTFYTCEALKPEHSDSNDISYTGNLYALSFASRQKDYKNVVKFVSDLNENNEAHFANYASAIMDENFYIVNTVNGIAGDPAQFHQLVNYYKTKGIFNSKTHIDMLFKFRATLCLAISFGIGLGYKEIILCGVDLNDPRYFFEEPSLYPNSIKLKVNPENKSHSTITPNQLFVPINEVINELNKNICIPKNIKLSVQNPASVLTAILDVYQFETQ